MKLPPRIIARLDIKGPNLIKGIQFDGHRVLGLAETFALQYYADGADELYVQDTVASLYKREALFEIIKKTAKKVFIPLTVGGGIRSVDDIKKILSAGADKVAINTAITQNPKLITDAAKIYGSQCIVASLDVFRSESGKYSVWVDYGREVTNLDALEWAKRVEDLGAGEILITSINRDGTGKGFDLDLIQNISKTAKIPVIAGGGAGRKEHLYDAISQGAADAVAVGSLFHYNCIPKENHYEKRSIPLRMGEPIDTGSWDYYYEGYGHLRGMNVEPCSVQEGKQYLRSMGIQVRLENQ